MPRSYHSPSSNDLGRRCIRAWGYAYIEGLRPPDVPWSVIEAAGAAWANVATPKQRSTALGTAIHAKAEAYFLGKPVDFQDLPGRIFLEGARHLPHPSRLAAPPRVEWPIGDARVPELPGLDYGGVRWLGYVDLRVLPVPEESDRLGLPRGWVTIDYKSTKDLGRYAKSRADLEVDLQANIYGYDEILSNESGPDASIMRWVYFQTQGRLISRAVDFQITAAGAQKILDAAADRALYLDTFESVEACPPNPSACGDYGGCEYHRSKGGPCPARARLGALIQAHTLNRKDQNMAVGFLEKHRANAAAKAAGQPLPYPDMPGASNPGPAAPTPPPAPAPTPGPAAAPPEPPPAGANGAPEPPPEPAPAKKGPGRPRATPSAGAQAPVESQAAPKVTGPVTCELRVTGSPAALVDLLQRFPA